MYLCTDSSVPFSYLVIQGCTENHKVLPLAYLDVKAEQNKYPRAYLFIVLSEFLSAAPLLPPSNNARHRLSIIH